MGKIEKLILSALALLLVSAMAAGPAHAKKCTPDQADLTRTVVAPVVAQRCPCASQEIGDKWKNHGRYVSCVNRTTNQLFKQNDIARSCKRLIKKCASRSTCGKEDRVLCCRGRERECVADTNPGDTIADGQCAHDTVILCDTNADCIEAKCKIAKDDLKCTDRGGVPNGTGSCCGAAGCALVP